MKKYCIYHIPGVKIGCSVNPKQRVKRQGHYKFEILEEHTDIDIASEREIELQKKYGYRPDTTKYKQICEAGKNRCTTNFTNEARSKGGKTSGKNAVISGQLQSVAHLGGKVGGKTAGRLQSQKEYTCPTCKKTGRGNGFVGHINKCK
jgi:hypothetical protein